MEHSWNGTSSDLKIQNAASSCCTSLLSASSQEHIGVRAASSRGAAATPIVRLQ